MATLFYGINVGDEQDTVSISATTTGKDIEIAVNNLDAVTARDVLAVHLMKLRGALDQNPWLPL